MKDKFHDDFFDIKSSDFSIFDVRTLLWNLYQNMLSRQSPTIFDYDVTELIQTNRKRQHFVRNRRLMSDCFGSCYRRMQSLIKCKQLCFQRCDFIAYLFLQLEMCYFINLYGCLFFQVFIKDNCLSQTYLWPKSVELYFKTKLLMLLFDPFFSVCLQRYPKKINQKLFDVYSSYILLMRVITGDILFLPCLIQYFLVISFASLCSSTSLYNYLTQHFEYLPYPLNCISRTFTLSDSSDTLKAWLMQLVHNPKHLPYTDMHITRDRRIRVS